MRRHSNRPADTWSPLQIPAFFGEGGFAVTVFIYLMFRVPRPGQPVPVFEDIFPAFSNGGVPASAGTIAAVTGIAGFVFHSIRSRSRNLARMAAFRRPDVIAKRIRSNGETQPVAMPLASAKGAVGMAAPAAMSTVPLTVGIAKVLSVMTGTIAGLHALIAAIVAFNSMLHHGTAKDNAPRLTHRLAPAE